MTWERIVYRRGRSADSVSYRITPDVVLRGTVLFVHGAGNDALFGIVGLAKRLLLDGYRVAAFDLDGHGRASTTRFSGADIGAAIPTAVERLCGDAGGLLHGVGVSLGGSILLHALGARSLEMSSAVLMVAPLEIRFATANVISELRPHLLRTLWREREHYGLTGLIPSFGSFKRDTYPLRLEGPETAGGSFAYIESLNRTLKALELEDAASGVDTPVLLVYGDADRVVPIGQGERLKQLMGTTELLRIPGGTHLTTPFEPAATAAARQWILQHS